MDATPLKSLDEKDIIKKMPKLELIHGGKTPPDGEDWLSPMEVGTSFLASNKSVKSDDLIEFQVYVKTKQSVRLRIVLPDNSEIFSWRIPLEFCRKHSLHEIIENEVIEVTYE